MNGPGFISLLRQFATVFCMLSVAQHASAQNAKVRVGKYASTSDARGIDVEIVQINSGATLTTELANGNLDAAGGSPGAGLYNAVRQGIPLKIVADKGSTTPATATLRSWFARTSPTRSRRPPTSRARSSPPRREGKSLGTVPRLAHSSF